MTMRYLQKYLPVSAALIFLRAGTVIAQDVKKTPAPQAAPEAAPSPATGKTDESVDKLVENFFALLAKDQTDQACDYLTNGTKIAENLEWVAALKVKTKEAIKASGEIQGSELLSIQNVGTHLMRSTYVSLGKGYPLIWKFYFYRSDKAWKLIDLRLEVGLSDVFEDGKLPTQQPAAGR